MEIQPSWITFSLPLLKLLVQLADEQQERRTREPPWSWRQCSAGGPETCTVRGPCVAGGVYKGGADPYSSHLPFPPAQQLDQQQKQQQQASRPAKRDHLHRHQLNIRNASLCYGRLAPGDLDDVTDPSIRRLCPIQVRNHSLFYLYSIQLNESRHRSSIAIRRDQLDLLILIIALKRCCIRRRETTWLFAKGCSSNLQYMPKRPNGNERDESTKVAPLGFPTRNAPAPLMNSC